MAPLEPHSVHSKHSRYAYEPVKPVIGGIINRQDEVKWNEGDQVPQQAMGSVVEAYLREIVDKGTVWKVQGPKECGNDVQKLNDLQVLQCTYVLISCTLSAAFKMGASKAEQEDKTEQQ
jgi:hypothetical protein